MALPLVKYLDDAVRATGVPLVGIVVGNSNDRSTWTAQLEPTATPADIATAANVLATFDVSTIPTLAADSDAVLATNAKVIKALVAYVYKVTHAGVNPTGPQLAAELLVLKTLYKALP